MYNHYCEDMKIYVYKEIQVYVSISVIMANDKICY